MTDKTPTANLPSIVVISDINNRKFRMALKGSLERLSVAKIKSYLQQSTKVPASEQILQFHGATLQDNLVGGDFGLHHDAVLHMNSISNLQQQQQQDHQQHEHHYQSHQQQNSGTTPPPNLPDFHQNTYQKTTPSSPPPPPPPSQSTHYHQSASMEYGYQHQHQHVPSRPAPSVPNDANNNNNNKRLADELAAIRTSLDSDKKKQQQQQSYFSPSSSSASRQMNDEENVRPDNTNKNTVHSATAESTIPESLLMASTRFGGKYYPNKTSSPSRNNAFGEDASSSSSVPVPSSSPLSGMQIQSSLLVNENSQMKKEIDQLKGKIQALEAALQASNNTNDSSTTSGGFAPGGVLAAARAQLHGLSQELGMMDLSFDDNFTCVIGSDDSTVLLTVDPATERLYLYATLLESLDKIQDERKKNKIYRALLEWSMLGRDMAGGGVGIDASTGVVIMSTSIDLKNSKTPALRDTAPVFVESLVRWRQALNTLMTA